MNGRAKMGRRKTITLVLLGISLLMLSGCEGLVPHDVSSLLLPTFRRSEVVGFLAGFGTTFAAVPDLVAMFRCRSSAE